MAYPAAGVASVTVRRTTETSASAEFGDGGTEVAMKLLHGPVLDFTPRPFNNPRKGD